MIGLGILGTGSVFTGGYLPQIDRMARQGRVEIRAVYDVIEGRKREVAETLGVDPTIASAEALIARDDIDVVCVLTSMIEHGPLSIAALEAGKHVLVEKPMATALAEGAEMVRLAAEGRSLLLCAPHVMLSPTFQEMSNRISAGDIGQLHLGRARYGWSGPWWGPWFYRPGGGALFDLGIYNLLTLCGFFGSVKRVTGFIGTAVAERVVDGETMRVEADDNSHLVLDFGNATYANLMTGFTLQAYRSPAVEVYGSEGVLQLMGNDWAPEGFEQWRNANRVWEIVPETNPTWPWTDGINHLVDCIEQGRQPITRPEHTYHALEVIEAGRLSAVEGRTVDVVSEFPAPIFADAAHAVSERAAHDPRAAAL